MGFGFWVFGFWFWVLGFGFWVLGLGFWVSGSGFWVLGSGFWVWGFGVLGFRGLREAGVGGVVERHFVPVEIVRLPWGLGVTVGE